MAPGKCEHDKDKTLFFVYMAPNSPARNTHEHAKDSQIVCETLTNE